MLYFKIEKRINHAKRKKYWGAYPYKKKAVIKAMSEAGSSSQEIADTVGVDQHTVLAILKQPICTDQALITALQERELNDLTVLGGIARQNIVKKIIKGGGNITENVIVMDRTFQQRRLLAGQSTSNHIVLSIQAGMEELKKAREEVTKMEEMLRDD